MADSTILSFRHSCQTSGNILCFQLPHYCPICGRSLMEEPLSTPPVRYPPILRSSNAYPFSIVIKPTNGSFLGDYNHGDNLHTGITDSKGFLCHFNEQGINYDRSIWHQSLVIPLLDKSDLELSSLWDEKLSQIILGPTWRAECYVELGHNCFDFVVAFLNLVQYNHLKRSSSVPITRQALVDGYILATTSRATKYINFIREIRSRGFLLQLDRWPRMTWRGLGGGQGVTWLEEPTLSFERTMEWH